MRIARRHIVLFICLVIALAFAGLFRDRMSAALSIVKAKMSLPKTVAERVQEHGGKVRLRLKPHFERAAVKYPPDQLMLIGLKQEARLQLYGANLDGKFRFIHSYPILAASGGPGPKLREGDHQVPEGIYPVESLNPNSRYHLALRVGYPNALDRERAGKEGRKNLGGDIMIHGSAVSVGCLAMGDEAAEDLFVLAADTGLEKITVILTPVDFRLGRGVPKSANLPTWTGSLYDQIKTRLQALPLENAK